MKNLIPQVKSGSNVKSKINTGATTDSKKTSSSNPLKSIIGIVLCVFVFVWLVNVFTTEPIEKQLYKGQRTYFSFDGRLGDKMVVFTADKANVDFTIISQDGTTASSKNPTSSIMRKYHTGVFVVSNNKDTKMTITLE